jgi:hypothetical protein
MNCENYKLCESTLPKWWLSCVCTNCDMMFGTWNKHDGTKHIGKGTLEFKDDQTQCPICFEYDECVSVYPNCCHFICIACAKKCLYDTIEPDFPYPEIENEYLEFYEGNYMNFPQTWKEKYPLIKPWIDSCINNYQDGTADYLHKCPICRQGLSM